MVALGVVVGDVFSDGGAEMVLAQQHELAEAAPLWFNAVDLILAYLPMAWLGSRRTLRVKDGALL